MYFMPNLPAEEASSVLAPLGEGAFVIRNSSSQTGQFVLSYWMQGQARHVHIANDADGVHLKKSTTMFLCLSDLVGYYWLDKHAYSKKKHIKFTIQNTANNSPRISR